jgi:hypothetical protein
LLDRAGNVFEVALDRVEAGYQPLVALYQERYRLGKPPRLGVDFRRARGGLRAAGAGSMCPAPVPLGVVVAASERREPASE